MLAVIIASFPVSRREWRKKHAHFAQYYAGYQGNIARVNSVYQALFPPPAHKNMGTRICDHLTSSMTCCCGDAQKEVYTTLIIDEELISLELYLKKVPFLPSLLALELQDNVSLVPVCARR